MSAYNRIVITIEDIPGGKVRVDSTPKFSEMARMIVSGESMSDAHGYALAAMRAIREASKEAGPVKILLPRIGR